MLNVIHFSCNIFNNARIFLYLWWNNVCLLHKFKLFLKVKHCGHVKYFAKDVIEMKNENAENYDLYDILKRILFII